jgi:hypothetical protein
MMKKSTGPKNFIPTLVMNPTNKRGKSRKKAFEKLKNKEHGNNSSLNMEKMACSNQNKRC